MYSNVRLAPPTFSTGPQDDLATADVYKEISGETINSIQDISNNLSSDSGSNVEVLRGGAFIQSLVPVISGLSNGLPSWNKSSLLSRILISSSSLQSALRPVSNTTAGRIGSLIPQGVSGMVSGRSTLASQTNYVLTNVNGVSRRVNSSNLTDLASVGNLLNDVTSGSALFSVTDNTAIAGLYSGIIQEAGRLGIPNSFQAMVSAISNSSLVRKIGALSLPSMVDSSDVKGLKDIATTMAPGEVNLLNPNIVKDFSENYSAPMACTADDHADNYNDVMDAFRASDNSWDQRVRRTTAGDDTVVDISKLQTASPDFKKMLDIGTQQTTVSTTDKLYRVALAIPPKSVEAELKSQHPYTVLSSGQRSADVVIDPRLVTDPNDESTWFLKPSKESQRYVSDNDW